jgi:hypothetical protein
MEKLWTISGQLGETGCGEVGPQRSTPSKRSRDSSDDEWFHGLETARSRDIVAKHTFERSLVLQQRIDATRGQNQ